MSFSCCEFWYLHVPCVRALSVRRNQASHPTLSPLYDLLDPTNQIFSESLWYPLSTHPSPLSFDPNTNTQIHKYTNTASVKVAHRQNMCHIFEKVMVWGPEILTFPPIFVLILPLIFSPIFPSNFAPIFPSIFPQIFYTDFPQIFPLTFFTEFSIEFWADFSTVFNPIWCGGLET